MRPSPPPLKARRPRRRLLLLLAILLPLVAAGTPAALGFGMTYALVYAPCRADSTTPADFGHTYEDITIAARAEGEFRAFFIPGDNGAAVIIPPTTSGGRGDRLHIADLLVRHGYSVLTFDSRRCAGMGPISLGYKEVDDVGDALAYLHTRGDIAADRIGVSGFSSAGATAVMAGARYPDLHAVIAEGGYGDFAEGAIGLGTSANPLEAIFKWSLGISYRVLTGIHIDKLSPQDVIATIAPRPVLLIYGSEERSLAGAYDQLAAAGPNAALWVVPGARHGTYLATAPDAYEQRVIAFLDRALLDKPPHNSETGPN